MLAATLFVTLFALSSSVDDSRVQTDGTDGTHVFMSPITLGNSTVCKVCYQTVNGTKVCRKGSTECFDDTECVYALEKRLCPNIQRCENATAIERYPVVIGGEKRDGYYTVCECPPCLNIDDYNITDTDEKPVRSVVCCGYKRDDKLNYALVSEDKCIGNNGAVYDDETCSNDTITDYCTQIWDPVCDLEGTRYGNKCRANKAGVNSTELVECRDSCNCHETAVVSPICVETVPGTFVTVKNQCIYRCAKENGELPEAEFVGDDICPKDRSCRVTDEQRIPVCDKVNGVTYASLKECECDESCLTRDAYQLGRCTNENDCKCSEYVTDYKPLCRSKNGFFDTIRDRCKAFCANVIDITILGEIAAMDGSVITDGVCETDAEDCKIRDDVRATGCDESDRIPVRPGLKIEFSLSICYVDFVNRQTLFDSIREALKRIIYDHCNLTREDTDEVLVTSFTPLSEVVKEVANRTSECDKDQIFDVAIAIYASNFARILEATQCTADLGDDFIEKLRKRFLEAGQKRDPETTCECSTDPTVSCDDSVETDTSRCSECNSCSREDGTDGGYGDASVASSLQVITLNYDGSVYNSSVNVNVTTTAGNYSTQSSVNSYCLSMVFITLLLSLLF